MPACAPACLFACHMPACNLPASNCMSIVVQCLGRLWSEASGSGVLLCPLSVQSHEPECSFVTSTTKAELLDASQACICSTAWAAKLQGGNRCRTLKGTGGVGGVACAGRGAASLHAQAPLWTRCPRGYTTYAQPLLVLRQREARARERRERSNSSTLYRSPLIPHALRDCTALLEHRSAAERQCTLPSRRDRARRTGRGYLAALP